MRKFITVRGGGPHAPGTWYLMDEIGEACRPCRIASKDGKSIFAPIGPAVEFREIADFIVEHGFEMAQKHLNNIAKMNSRMEQQQLDDFSRSVEDLVDDEIERRGRENNPGHGGVVVPGNFRRNDEQD